MPGESKGMLSARETKERATEWKPPAEVIAQLKPWIDLDEVGPAGWHRWVEAILPLLPSPANSARSAGGDPNVRIRELSQAVAAAAGDAARAHFQAAEYFRENRVLARRLLALEAILRTRGTPAENHSSEVDAALARYLPHRERP